MFIRIASLRFLCGKDLRRSLTTLKASSCAVPVPVHQSYPRLIGWHLRPPSHPCGLFRAGPHLIGTRLRQCFASYQNVFTCYLDLCTSISSGPITLPADLLTAAASLRYCLEFPLRFHIRVKWPEQANTIDVLLDFEGSASATISANHILIQSPHRFYSSPSLKVAPPWDCYWCGKLASLFEQ